MQDSQGIFPSDHTDGTTIVAAAVILPKRPATREDSSKARGANLLVFSTAVCMVIAGGVLFGAVLRHEWTYLLPLAVAVGLFAASIAVVLAAGKYVRSTATNKLPDEAIISTVDRLKAETKDSPIHRHLPPQCAKAWITGQGIYTANRTLRTWNQLNPGYTTHSGDSLMGYDLNMKGMTGDKERIVATSILGVMGASAVFSLLYGINGLMRVGFRDDALACIFAGLTIALIVFQLMLVLRSIDLLIEAKRNRVSSIFVHEEDADKLAHMLDKHLAA